jgi:hypothetical protein
MSKLGRLWDWLLPGLISLSPMGAIAYYSAGSEREAVRDESPKVERRGLVFDAFPSQAVIPVAHR